MIKYSIPSINAESGICPSAHHPALFLIQAGMAVSVVSDTSTSSTKVDEWILPVISSLTLISISLLFNSVVFSVIVNSSNAESNFPSVGFISVVGIDVTCMILFIVVSLQYHSFCQVLSSSSHLHFTGSSITAPSITTDEPSFFWFSERFTVTAFSTRSGMLLLFSSTQPIWCFVPSLTQILERPGLLPVLPNIQFVMGMVSVSSMYKYPAFSPHASSSGPRKSHSIMSVAPTIWAHSCAGIIPPPFIVVM